MCWLTYTIHGRKNNMARPIGNTPELVGDEANEFIERMFEPPTEKQKKMEEEMKKQRFVPL